MQVRSDTVAIIPERLALFEAMSLKHGGHAPGGSEMCAMEAAAWIAGEPWSDSPACTCPVIASFIRAWNDGLPSDADRDRLLKPLVPVIVGTRASAAVEQRRSLMAADWLVRVHTPAWLRAAKLEDQAKLLESLPEITDMAQCPSLMPALLAVKKDADAARAAAWAAARAAAWAAARAAAWAAARAAAWAAARAALRPTVARLQDSAADLVRRMCDEAQALEHDRGLTRQPYGGAR